LYENRKSNSNLEKAGGYAYGAAKTITGAAKGLAKAEIAGLKAVGGFLMPQQKTARQLIKRTPFGMGPVKRKPFGGTETRPTEREGKRVAPRQRMPKELEKNPRRKRQGPKTGYQLYQSPTTRRPSPQPRNPPRRRNASGGGGSSSYGS
jgi:hypothetical protein